MSKIIKGAVDTRGKRRIEHGSAGVVYDLGEHIVSKVNNSISGEVIMSAVRNVYEQAYGITGEELDKKMEEIIIKNRNRQEVSFPRRRMEREDGTFIVLNDDNKFDISSDSTRQL